MFICLEVLSRQLLLLKVRIYDNNILLCNFCVLSGSGRSGRSTRSTASVPEADTAQVETRTHVALYLMKDISIFKSAGHTQRNPDSLAEAGGALRTTFALEGAYL